MEQCEVLVRTTRQQLDEQRSEHEGRCKALEVQIAGLMEQCAELVRTTREQLDEQRSAHAGRANALEVQVESATDRSQRLEKEREEARWYNGGRIAGELLCLGNAVKL